MNKLNIKLLIHLAGLVLLLESGFMFLCLIVSLVFRMQDLPAMAGAFLTTAGTGGIFFFLTRKEVRKTPRIREAFFFVSTIWIVISLFGSLPYLYSGAIPRFTDAYFETVSGFTTTGSSILVDIEALSKELLFWRALTHWMGGIGIIVMVIVILPSLKAGGVHLFSAESTKVSLDDVHVKVLDAAKRFGLIYVIITLLEVVTLTLGGMELFDSLCHSFATVATGGFGTKNTSIAGYSPFIQYAVTFFMFVSGINFTLHFLIGRGQLRQVLRNEELRLYTFITLSFTLLIFISLLTKELPVEWAFRSALFQVVSIITCTGFATDDYLLWPPAGLLLIFLAMFVGASAGSTGGGIKVVRHLLVFKNFMATVRSVLHPRTIYTVRYMGRPVPAALMQSVIAFYFWYLVIFTFSSLLIVLLGEDVMTSIGSVATTMAGIGPGLGKVGPVSNFSMLSDPVKIILTFTMLIGRLEIYSFLVLFSPAFWRR